MVRFYYKADVQQKAKILRKVGPLPCPAAVVALSGRTSGPMHGPPPLTPPKGPAQGSRALARRHRPGREDFPLLPPCHCPPLALLPPWQLPQVAWPLLFSADEPQSSALLLRIWGPPPIAFPTLPPPQVTFPLVLDAYELCVEGLQRELEAPRLAAKAAEEVRVGLAKKQKTVGATAAAGVGAAAAAGVGAAAAGGAQPAGGGAQPAGGAAGVSGGASTAAAAAEAAAGGATGDMEMAEAPAAAAGAAGDAGSSAAAAAAAGEGAAPPGALTGKYDLVAVLTHKGRSADSGHYVSWVKQVCVGGWPLCLLGQAGLVCVGVAPGALRLLGTLLLLTWRIIGTPRTHICNWLWWTPVSAGGRAVGAV